MNRECQKCGYVRLSTDTSPDYECPKCGVVYEKYDEYLKSRQQPEIKKKKINEKRDHQKHSLFLGTKTKFVNIKTLIRRSPIYLRIIYITLAILLVSLSVYLANYFSTPEDLRILRSRYSTYIEAAFSLDLDTSYQYLSSDSRSKINQYEWKIQNKEINPTFNEKIQAIKLSPDGISATITTATMIDRKPVKLYMQTWVKEGGTWFRDWAHDYPDRVIEAQKEAARLNNENSKPEIYRIETGFDIKRKDFGKILIIPKTTLVIYNNSEFPITYLRIKVDYYDKDEREILYSAEELIVSDDDTPIPSNGKSDVIYANSGAGFLLDITSIDSAAAKRIKSRVDRILSYKLSYQGQWIRLSTDELR